MNVRITSLRDAGRLLAAPAAYDVASIRGHKYVRALHPLDPLLRNAKSFVRVWFDDIWLPAHTLDGSMLPSRKEVERALVWAKGVGADGNFLVHCHAGVSRSSALAYLIACLFASPDEAIKVLNPLLHHPNEKVVQLGAEILGDPQVYWVFQRDYGDNLLGGLLA